MYYMWINKNLVHQVGDQNKVILRCTVNQPSRGADNFSFSELSILWRVLNTNFIGKTYLCILVKGLL
jgi:hypothetical protein